MKEAVERAVEMMRNNLSEPITIDDMARTAMYSKFHFTRVFERTTGISPGRFLSALRIEEAKRLLLSTSLSVTEISNEVGYSSVGTFSTRFKNSVGLAPSDFRQRRGFLPKIPVADGKQRGRLRSTTVRGRFRSSLPDEYGLIFVGLFPNWIPQGPPIRCAILRGGPGPFMLEDVPAGTWHLLAQSVPPGHEEFIDDQSPYIGAYGPISVRPGTALTPTDVTLRPAGPLDPPVLLALRDTRLEALHAKAS